MNSGHHAALLSQFCCEDATSVNTDGSKRKSNILFRILPKYHPYVDGEAIACKQELCRFSRQKSIPVIIGCDANAHHAMWGSRDTNHRGIRLAEYIATTNLELVIGVPPQLLSTRSLKLESTYNHCIPQIYSSMTGWELSEEETLSDHREINFWVRLGSATEPTYRNPRATKWDKFCELGRLGIQNVV